jgi:hypothetical protein
LFSKKPTNLEDEVYKKNKTNTKLISADLFTSGIVVIEPDCLKLINTALRDELKDNIAEKITLNHVT